MAMVVDNRWQFQCQSSLDCILKLFQIGPEFFLVPIENDFSSLIVFQVGGAQSIRLNVIAFYSLCKRRWVHFFCQATTAKQESATQN